MVCAHYSHHYVINHPPMKSICHQPSTDEKHLLIMNAIGTIINSTIKKCLICVTLNIYYSENKDLHESQNSDEKVHVYLFIYTNNKDNKKE